MPAAAGSDVRAHSCSSCYTQPQQLLRTCAVLTHISAHLLPYFHVYVAGTLPVLFFVGQQVLSQHMTVSNDVTYNVVLHAHVCRRYPASALLCGAAGRGAGGSSPGRPAANQYQQCAH